MNKVSKRYRNDCTKILRDYYERNKTQNMFRNFSSEQEAKKMIEKELKNLPVYYIKDNKNYIKDRDDQKCFFVEKVYVFMLAISCVINEIYNKKDDTVILSWEKNHTLSERAVLFSPFIGRVFIYDGGRNEENEEYEEEDEEYEDEEDDDEDEDEEDKEDEEDDDEKVIVEKNYTFNCVFKKSYKISAPKVLKPLADSIAKNILNCPYAWIFEPPNKNLKKNGEIDLRCKKSHRKDFKKFEKGDGNCSVSIQEVRNSSSSRILKIFKDKLLSVLLELGGPFTVEFFERQFDITYNNENIEDINKSRQFYAKTYHDVLENLEGMDINIKVLNIFYLETQLNGSFLFAFVNFFSENATSKWVKIIEEAEVEKSYMCQLEKLFSEMNRIRNPFIKCGILDEVVFPSYNNDYVYKGHAFKAGKKNPIEWISNLCSYCNDIYEWESKIHILYKTPEKNDYETVFEKFYELFDQHAINKVKNDKRGRKYKEILKTAIISNHKYYPLSRGM